MANFPVTIDVKKYKNFVGEYLRDHFFNQKDGKVGITFELNKDIDELDSDTTWRKAYSKKLNVEMKYSEDGDGILIFHLKDSDILLINDDCKKINNWGIQ